MGSWKRGIGAAIPLALTGMLLLLAPAAQAAISGSQITTPTSPTFAKKRAKKKH